MPIKEIVGLTVLIMTGWFITGGQQAMMKNIRSTQIRILKEVVRTDNWGNPSIFRPEFSKKYSRKPISQ